MPISCFYFLLQFSVLWLVVCFLSLGNDDGMGKYINWVFMSRHMQYIIYSISLMRIAMYIFCFRIPCIQCCLSKSYMYSPKHDEELLERDRNRDTRENIKEQMSKMTLIFIVVILIALCSTLLLLYFFYSYFGKYLYFWLHSIAFFIMNKNLMI